MANAAGGFSTDLSRLSFEVQSVGNIIGSPATSERASSLLSPSDRALHSISANVAPPASTSSQSGVADVVGDHGAGELPAAPRRSRTLTQRPSSNSAKKASRRLAAAQEMVRRQLELYQTPQSSFTGDYAMLTQQLSNLRIAESSANGNFTVIAPATPPSSPIAPKPVQSAVFGLIAGLFLGVILAFVVGQFDTRVRTYRRRRTFSGSR